MPVGVSYSPLHVSVAYQSNFPTKRTRPAAWLMRKAERCLSRAAVAGLCCGVEAKAVSLPSHHFRRILIKVCPIYEYIRQYQSFGVSGSAVGCGTALQAWKVRWRSWLRYCATSRKVAGSIPGGAIGRMVDSTSNRNEYEEYFRGVKAAGA